MNISCHFSDKDWIRWFFPSLELKRISWRQESWHSKTWLCVPIHLASFGCKASGDSETWTSRIRSFDFNDCGGRCQRKLETSLCLPLNQFHYVSYQSSKMWICRCQRLQELLYLFLDAHSLEIWLLHIAQEVSKVNDAFSSCQPVFLLCASAHCAKWKDPSLGLKHGWNYGVFRFSGVAFKREDAQRISTNTEWPRTYCIPPQSGLGLRHKSWYFKGRQNRSRCVYSAVLESALKHMFSSKVHESSRPAEREHSQCPRFVLPSTLGESPRILRSFSGGFGLALQSEHSAGHLQIAIALVGYFEGEHHTMSIHCSSYIIILISLISQNLSNILYRCAAKADWRFCGGEHWPFQSAHAWLSLSQMQSKLPVSCLPSTRLIQRSGFSMLHHTYCSMVITI